MKLTVALVLLLTAIPRINASYASAFACSDCGCKGAGSFTCHKCAGTYQRIYDPVTEDCPCFKGFYEPDALSSFSCCTKNCLLCSYWGCTKCKTGFIVRMGHFSQGECICPQHYFEDGSNCQCLSKINPRKYYEVPADSSCLPCPIGCLCDAHGCSSCQKQTNRVVIAVKTPKEISANSCPCIPPFVESHGSCICPSGCTCRKGTIKCSGSSHRYLSSFGSWECRYPWTENNGTCACLYPYNETNPGSESSECVCGSYFDQNTIYLTKENECIACPSSCGCNSVGCVTCRTLYNLPRRILGNGCTCPYPNRELLGLCICYAPYYNTAAMDCYCKNRIHPGLYYNFTRDNFREECAACPSGCNCTISSCVSCLPNTLRIVEVVNNYSICVRCRSDAYEFEGRCLCINGRQPVDGVCDCQDLDLFYNNQQGCLPCPVGCRCSKQQGCYFCEESTLRNVTLDSKSGLFTCNCIAGARIGDVMGTCYCSLQRDEQNSSKCICPEPYFMDSQGDCQCRSIINSTRYYRNFYTNECFECPKGCQCDISGCKYCLTNSQRYQFVDDGLPSDPAQCTCFQNTLLRNGSCTYCEPYVTYYYNGDCVRCIQCKECDWYGRCTSCNENLTLTNGTCVCSNSSLVRISGKCSCPTKTFLSVSDNSCQPCPVECEDCKLGIGRLPIINCITCRQGVHRRDFPSYNCPCQQGYIESTFERGPYCCKPSCRDCNETGCTSCLTDLYRQLDANQECVCIGELIPLNKTQLCGCLDGFYQYRLACRPCPAYCLTCVFNFTQEIVQCTACPVNSNRVFSNSSNGTNCQCQDYFVEASPPMSYCFPVYCVKQEFPCTQCINGMRPNADGNRCLCNGSFLIGTMTKCETCTVIGCIQCFFSEFCALCNLSDNYYLTEMSCKKKMEESKYLFVQNRNGMIVQFVNTLNSTDAVFVTVNGSLQPIVESLDRKSIVKLRVNVTTKIEYFTHRNIITAVFDHPLEQMENCMLAIAFGFTRELNPIGQTRYDNRSGTLSLLTSQSVYVKLKKVQPQSVMGFSMGGSITGWMAMMVVVFVLCMIFYVKGYKHNQTLFFLQTHAFLAFVLLDQAHIKTAYLYSLRYSYLDFGNALHKVIPEDLLESSIGNFPFFTIDSNFLRLASTTLVVALTVAVLSGFLRIFFQLYLIFKLVSLRGLINNFKIVTYRLLEFLYKTCMYPLLFFSFVQFANWSPQMMILEHQTLSKFCQGLSIVVPLAYLVVTTCQLRYEQISRLYKFENASEFFCDCLAAGILASSFWSKRYLFVVIVFVFRGFGYLLIRKSISRDFRRIEYLRLVSIALQVASLVCTLSDLFVGTGALIICATVCQLVHTTSVVFLSEQQSNFEKQAGQISGCRGNSHSSFTTETEGNINDTISKT